MASKSAKAGQMLAKVLGIKLDDYSNDSVTRGESVFSIATTDTDTFVEEEPTTVEWLREQVPSGRNISAYVISLFPFLNWAPFYNLSWLTGDLVAGCTIGAVVVPQGMAYALLANLPPEYGLYSSFMGVALYWIFATSKDITIGPVAVMSTLVGNAIVDIRDNHPDISATDVAGTLAILAGGIICFIGLIRCGWIVDLISLTSLSAFMTGSALSIASGQLSSLMGLTGIDTRDAAYLVFINSLKHLDTAKLDAAIGITALVLLYLIRSSINLAAKRWPQHKRSLFFTNTLRTVFVILLYTLISWLVNHNRRSSPAFKLIGHVPRGFKHAGVPNINSHTCSVVGSYLPATVIVLVVEHIAISKSFGRINDYTINPSQEMVAIGVTNLLGPFLGAYPATGSFSRTAIKSKAGVRTPFASVITAVVVVLAVYALPAVFFYIPKAALAAVIIHAVMDLITPPNTVYQFWRVSPIEVLIFFVGVFVSIFSSIENGIYSTVCISMAVMLFRILKARGDFLGRVRIQSVLNDRVIGEHHTDDVGAYGTFKSSPANAGVRNVFLPINHGDGSNPVVAVESPYPGIFIYRLSEGFNYPNASHTLSYFTRTIFKQTRRTSPQTYANPGDRPWNDPGPKKAKNVARNEDLPADDDDEASKPTLKAIILDFSSVNNVDITSVQQLIDVRNQLDRYAAPEPVDWHIACINNRWTKRALASAGFGYPLEQNLETPGLQSRWKSIFSVAELGGDDSAASVAEKEANNHVTAVRVPDEETISPAKLPEANQTHLRRRRRGVVVHGLNRPLFHIDLTNALQSAIANVEARTEVYEGVAHSEENGGVAKPL
ncbi:sulfate permease [Ceratocystis lukuohia]|uniref:Sulfate permease n=1 Tax=Ceratocystis lukuohia TaxID=2019550 RepID=A0ABR4MKN1_9PEZI